MDFTRQPIIETVITAKEGCKLVIRSSKSTGQEEYFVDAIEVVSFGSTFFFRSQEKPKAFLVPTSDYEVLEVREARMVLKNVGMNRAIKIGGGKEKPLKEVFEKPLEKPVVEKAPKEKEKEKEKEEEQELQAASRQTTERKRDRRRSFKRRKRGEEPGDQMDLPMGDIPLIPPPPMAISPIRLSETRMGGEVNQGGATNLELSATLFGSLLPPPPNLISETIERYKDNKLFEGVFVGAGKRGKLTPEKAPEEKVNLVEEREEGGCLEEFSEPIQKGACVEEEAEIIQEVPANLQEDEISLKNDD